MVLISYPCPPVNVLPSGLADPEPFFKDNEAGAAGFYPVGENRFWHGGIHLYRRLDANGGPLPVLAIAGGTIVAYRLDQEPLPAYEPLRDRPPPQKYPCSSGFVLIRHTAEFSRSTQLTFYSLYMHLLHKEGLEKVKLPRFLTGEVTADDTRVPAGTPVEILEQEGPGKPVKVKLQGRDVWLPRAPKVRPGKMKGEQVLAESARRTYAEHPQRLRSDITYGAVMTCSIPIARKERIGYPGRIAAPESGVYGQPDGVFQVDVFMDEANAKVFENPNGDVWGRRYNADPLDVYEKIPNPTIPLDAKAADRFYVVGKGKKARRVDRFTDLDGKRNRGSQHVRYTSAAETTTEGWLACAPGETFATCAGLAADVPHLYTHDPDAVHSTEPTPRKTTLPAGTLLVAGTLGDPMKVGADTWGTVTLADGTTWWVKQPGEVKLWTDADWLKCGWTMLSEHGSYSDDGFCDEDALMVALDANKDRTIDRAELAAAAPRLRRTICVHPTEWSKLNNDRKYAGLLDGRRWLPMLRESDYRWFIEFVEKLQFWQDVPDLPDPDRVVHVHPIAFAEHAARCMWLSVNELKVVLPAAEVAALSRYQGVLNDAMAKWGVSTRVRQGHFLAQGAHECGSLKLMTEGRSSYASSRSRTKGRGFFQLTGEGNYTPYGAYVRGNVPGYEQSDLLANPDPVASDDFLACDSAGWYWTTNSVGRSADKGWSVAVVDEVGRVINRGPGTRNKPAVLPLHYEDRRDRSAIAFAALLDEFEP